MRGLVSLLRVFQLESQRRQNEMQALAPGSMHPRVHATTIAMTVGALMALGGPFIHQPLLSVAGIVVFAVGILVVVVQAIVEVLRSN